MKFMDKGGHSVTKQVNINEVVCYGKTRKIEYTDTRICTSWYNPNKTILVKFIGFLNVCSGPPNFKIFRGPQGPGPVGPWVNASLIQAQNRPILRIL